MTCHVIDASVAIKWFIPNAAGEGHVPQALRLLQLYLQDEIVCLQPPHFIAEMLGVLTRKCPEQVADQLVDLLDMGFKVSETPEIYARASELSVNLQHHSFDTLYHAVVASVKVV